MTPETDTQRLARLLAPVLQPNQEIVDVCGTATLFTYLPEESEIPFTTDLDGDEGDFQRLSELALDALATAQAENERLRGALEGVSGALSEGFPDWKTGYESQEGFEESVWQSDRAHEAALPTICAIRAALDGAL